MRSALLFLLRIPIRIFYRRWRLGGELPREGPLLVVANHPNGLVDPVVVATLSPRPLRFLAKEPLFRMPVLGSVVRALGSLPVHRQEDAADPARNEDTFRAVHEALARGEAVCLFPEGTSHSEPALRKLKTGAARMALGAEARAGFQLGARVVPLGLVYGAKQRFRSKLATWVGEPIDVADLAAAYREDERAAVELLTERIADGLRAVTLDLDRWEDLPLLELVERVWRPEGAPERRRGRRVARLRALAQGLRELRAREPERLARVEGDVEAFAELLARLRVAPADLDLEFPPRVVARFALSHLAGLALGTPLALAGVLAWGPPYVLVAAAVAVARPSEDLVATAKLLAALVLYTAWWIGGAILLALLGSPLLAALWTVAGPALGRFTLFAVERQRAARHGVATFLRSVSRRALMEELRRRRDALARELDAVAASL